MFWPAVLLLVSLLCNTSAAYNVDISETFSIYLRNGGSSGLYNASQEPAYAGYTFDAKLMNNVTNILVGQPRSGEEGRVVSPGSIYHCSNLSYVRIEPTTMNAYAPTTLATTGSGYSGSHQTTESPDSATTSSTAVGSSNGFTAPSCQRLQIFDQTSLTQRSLDHKNNADALGLNLGKIGDTDDYVVCAPLRQRTCPKDPSSVPGACYYGEPDQNYWNFMRWNETQCFDQTIDIIFVVDGSGSIGDVNFGLVKKWLIKVTAALIDTFGEAVRTEVLQYSYKDKAKDRVPIKDSTKFVIPYTLNDGLTIEEITTAINRMRYISGQTFTYYALRRVMEVEFAKSDFNDVSKKIVVVLTDGAADDKAALPGWYEKYKEEVTPYAVGVGKYRDFLSDLRAIANGNNGDERVLTVDRFDQLQDVVLNLTSEIQSASITEDSTTSGGNGAIDDTRNRQLGTAIASDKSGTLFLGAAGMYLDSGMVVKFDNISQPNSNQPTYQNVEEALPNRTEDSYLGYTVVTGYFDGVSRGEYVAAGAPRYMLRGAVVVYKPAKGDGEFHDHVTLMAPGSESQIAAYFGGSLLSLDVNGDGKDDLFVASPLYVEGAFDEGRVFLYISQDANSAKTWAEASYNPIQLFGDHSAGGRFGTAMANAGDMNLDGYNDVAIGAPLADGGQGAVFIYHGMKGGMMSAASQRIHASSLNGPTLMYFGQSLQGNVDVDGNQYPDIFVGAPKSDSIVILRSRPIVKILSTIEFTTTNVNVFDCIQKGYKNCTAVKICLFANGTTVESSIGIQYAITADSGKKTITERRFEFSSTNTTISENVTVTTNVEYCVTKPLSMKKNAKDYAAVLAARLDFDLAPSHVNTPFSSVRDPTLANSETTNIEFEKECKSYVCVPDLQLTGEMTLPSFTKTKNGITTDFTENGTVLIIARETSEKQTKVRLNLTNIGENAFETKVRATYTAKISLTMKVISGSPTSSCLIEDGSPTSQGPSLKAQEFRYNHEQDVMRPNAWCFFELDVVTDDLKDSGTLENFTVTVAAFTRSSSSVENITTNNDWKKTPEEETRIRYRSDLELKRASGTAGQDIKFNYTTESHNITSVSDIGSGTTDIRMAFVIKRAGYSNIPFSEITLTWPWMTEEGDPLMYLFQVECKEKNQEVDSGKCVCGQSNVNPYNLKTGSSEVNTTTGQTTVKPATIPITVDELNCLQPTNASHKCEHLKCQIYNLTELVELHFTAHFRLWTSSIIFNGTESVKLRSDFVVSTAKSPLLLTNNFENVAVHSEEVTTTVTKYKAEVVIDPPSQIWIYILAAAGGFLLLVVLCIVLWRVGFFESKYGNWLEDQKEQLDNELNFPDRPSDPNCSVELLGYESHIVIDATEQQDNQGAGLESNGNGVGATYENSMVIEPTKEEKAQSAAQLSNYENVEKQSEQDDPDYDLPPDPDPDNDLSSDPDYDLPPDSE